VVAAAGQCGRVQYRGHAASAAKLDHILGIHQSD